MITGRNKLIYVGSIAIGLLIGIIAYFVQPVRWESSALIALGQIPNNRSLTQSMPLENVQIVTERLKSASFIADAVKRSNRPAIKSILDKNEENGVTIKPLKSGDSLVITVTCKSPELSQIATRAVVNELIYRHDLLIDSLREDIQREIKKSNHESASITKLINMANEASSKGHVSQNLRDTAAGFNSLILLSEVSYNKIRVAELNDMISATNIRPTRLLESTPPINKKLIPSLFRSCLSGALLGALLGIIWVQWKRSIV